MTHIVPFDAKVFFDGKQEWELVPEDGHEVAIIKCATINVEGTLTFPSDWRGMRRKMREVTVNVVVIEIGDTMHAIARINAEADWLDNGTHKVIDRFSHVFKVPA